MQREKQKDQDYFNDENFINAFGKGGSGAPLRDQFGNTITTRKPHMNEDFQRQPVKGILKKGNNYDYERSES